MSYGEIKQWPQWLVRVENGVVVEERIFNSPDDVTDGWVSKDTLNNGEQPQARFQEEGQEEEADKKPAPRRRKMSE